MRKRTAAQVKVVAKNAWFQVVRITGSGSVSNVVRIRNPGVRIIALSNLSEVLLVSQYRPALDTNLWELPAGGQEPAETALNAAKRELWEETGFVADKWRSLGITVSLPSYTDMKSTLFVAYGLSDGPKRLDAPQFSEVTVHKFFSFDQLTKMIETGNLIDEKTLAGLLRLQMEQPWLPSRSELSQRT